MNAPLHQPRPAAGAATSAATGSRAASRGRGFSLVEAMVSAGIVGVMLVASVNLLSSAARTRASDTNRRSAVLLAQQLITEVQAQPYKDESLTALLFGPELGETGRALYDDVDDYKNHMEKPPLQRDGTPMADYPGWKRQVKVKWVHTDGLLTEAISDTGLVMIEVKVVDPRGVETSISALRAERAAPADPPLSGSTWVEWAEVELHAGGDVPRRAVTGVHPVARPIIVK